jgi:plastocyanin
MTTRRFRSALRVAAGAATALVVAYPAAVSAFSTADPAATIQALDEGGVSRWDKPTVQVAVGDTVRWAYDRALTVHALNVAGYSGPLRQPGDPPDDVTFPQEGRFTYSCPVHAGMVGELTVGNPPPATVTPTPPPSVTTTPVATTTPTPTATATATSTPTPSQAPPTGSGSPPPAADLAAPRIGSVRARVTGGRLVVRARVSEGARITLQARKRATVIRRSAARDDAGSLTVKARLRPGSWRLSLRAVDAAGNRSTAVERRVRVRR